MVGHFHYMIPAGCRALGGIFAGTYYWFPKMFGRAMNETLGKIHFWLTFPSVYAVFLTMHFVGFTGMMRHIYDPTAYDFLKQMIPWNRFITWAAFTLFFAQLVFLWNLFWSIWRGPRVSEPDPWQANTLEWTTPSPPPHGNWPAELPVVVRWPYAYGPDPDTREPQAES